MSSLLKFYFGTEGRLGRKDFFIKFYGVWLLVLFLILLLEDTDSDLSSIYGLVTLWPYLATLVKRFHDFGQSGLIAIVGYHVLLSVVLAPVMFVTLIFILPILLQVTNTTLAFLPYYAIPILIMLIPALIPGTKGPNKYGPATGGAE